MDLEWLSSLSLFTKLSIWTTLLPMAFSLRVIRRFPSAFLMLGLFVAGLFTELSTQKAGSSSAYSEYAFLAYSVLECTVFFHLTYPVKGLSLALGKSFIVFSFPLLLAAALVSPDMPWTIAVFNMAYQVGISFFAGRYLLRSGEAGVVAPTPMFWLSLGIFFYCFTTFFLMGIIALTAAHRLWDTYHNTINIVTYLIYTFSFWQAYRMTGRHSLS
jgi:hypothetical protein